MIQTNFRTPALDTLAREIIPAEHFEFSAETARDRFFNDTRMLDVKQWVHNAFRTNPKSMLDHMLDNLALTGSEDLLDLGCGNGFILEGMRPHLAEGSITGLDIAPAVLAAAKERLRGTATPCTWIEGSADEAQLARKQSTASLINGAKESARVSEILGRTESLGIDGSRR